MLGLQHALSHPEARADPPTTPIAKLIFVLQHLEHTSKITAILSFATLGVLIAVRIIKQHAVKRPGGKWLRFVPEILLVVAGTTGEWRRLWVPTFCSLTISPHRDLPMGSQGTGRPW